MSSEMQKHRVINELRDFIKKLLQSPQTLEQALEVARRHHAGGAEAAALIAREITDTTSIHIPDDPQEYSEADVLFLELLKEVVDEEQALY